MTVPSPCTGICRIEGDTCAGCLRTLAEIAQWPTATDAEKRAILARLAERTGR
ncbi:MAG TPA: DUF1289 domain-containing protein [Sphingomonas sp.]|uniref:DUF1289 domain-containing protein n=1 Tax=Sphingomonas sp. TaxID=28214 RepID=UPI002ED94012